MARIRSIKPEFWASEQIMELTPIARLAFIGMWNFADDGGVHPASPKTLKAEVFPSDAMTTEDVARLVGEMFAQGLVMGYESGGKTFWRITGWGRHQRIDKPTYRHPRPDVSQSHSATLGESSTNTSRMLGESSTTERSGEETKGEETSRDIPTSDEVGSDQASPDHAKQIPKTPDCPHQQIIALYAKHLPTLSQPRIWEGQRAENLRARWRWVLTAKRSDGKRHATDVDAGLDFFERVFVYVAASDFLTGRDGKWQGCDLGWLVKAENFAKVIEGKYENRKEAAA